MDRPHFRFHPGAYEAVFEQEEGVCSCCGQNRSLKYEGPFYSQQSPDYLCPWCIASGQACETYDGELVGYTDIEGVSPDPADPEPAERHARGTALVRAWISAWREAGPAGQRRSRGVPRRAGAVSPRRGAGPRHAGRLVGCRGPARNFVDSDDGWPPPGWIACGPVPTTGKATP